MPTFSDLSPGLFYGEWGLFTLSSRDLWCHGERRTVLSTLSRDNWTWKNRIDRYKPVWIARSVYDFQKGDQIDIKVEMPMEKPQTFNVIKPSVYWITWLIARHKMKIKQYKVKPSDQLFYERRHEKGVFWFATRVDSNLPAQLQKLGRDLIFLYIEHRAIISTI